MKKENRHNYTEERPWGSFVTFALNEAVTVKIITVKAGQAFSLQSHRNRDEFWRIISGRGIVTVGDDRKEIRPGVDYKIARGVKHRIEAGLEPVVFLEISRGDFDENDISRFADRYGRA